MEKLEIHLDGVICWLPQKKGKDRIPPCTPFRALALFTSNLPTPEFHDVLVTYSPFPIGESLQDCFKVRLHFPFWRGKEGEIEKFAKNSEIVLLDAFIVVAVCRDLDTSKSSSRFMEDDWEK